MEIPAHTMRILITTFTAEPEVNGIAEVVAWHARGLAARGHEVTLATGFNPLRHADPSVQQFSIVGSSNLKIGISGETQKYRDFILNWSGDVIMCHCWQIWSTDLLFPLLRTLRPKKIMVSHGFSAHRYPLGTRFPRGLLSWLGWRPYVWRCTGRMRLFDRIVFLAHLADNGPYFDRQLAMRAGLANTAVIPTGVDLTEFDREMVDIRSLWGLRGEKLVLCVANYGSGKNQMMALEALAVSGVSNVDLVFIGSEMNEYAMRLRERAEVLSRSGQVGRIHVLHGIQRDAIRAAYRAADVSLCTSQWESGPLIVLESMAAGTAFVSTDVGFVRTLPGGLIAKDAQEMGVKLRQVLTERGFAERLGRAGRRACEETYNWPRIISEYDMLLKAVAKSF